PAALRRRCARHHGRRVLHTQRPQPRRGRGQARQGHQADGLRGPGPAPAPGRRADGGERDQVSQPPRRGSTPRGRGGGPTPPPAPRALVALVERRGKFQVAEPFFGPGPRLALSRDSSYEVGDLVLVTPTPSGRRGTGSRAKVARRLGKPDIARDV